MKWGKDVKEIIKQIENNNILLEIDNTIYDVKAILKAAYKFTDKCHIHNENLSAGVIGVYFELKNDIDTSLEQIVSEFRNELIDQQIRVNIEKEYGKIRDELVRRAFSPVEDL